MKYRMWINDAPHPFPSHKKIRNDISYNFFLFQVRSILKSYRWAPFLPVSTECSMLSVLLLLSKYRLRNVPVIEEGKPDIKNYITQSAVVQGLDRCNGRDWFDLIAMQPISELGLPFMLPAEVRCVLLHEYSAS